jgi:prepilin-type N-terminal cleavage/methylation domain-containing protein
MRQPPPSQHRAFTLIEMITAIAVIVILTGLVIMIAGPVQRSGYRAKAASDVQSLVAGCEAYKADQGGYPQEAPSGGGSSVTNDVDPRIHTNPTAANYAASSLFLYKQLSGDENSNGTIEGTETNRRYVPDFFKSSRFDSVYRTSGRVSYIADPFGFPYGYSTAGLKAEQDYQVALQTNPSATRPATAKGYNPIFDLWSTGGATGSTPADTAKWLKNW